MFFRDSNDELLHRINLALVGQDGNCDELVAFKPQLESLLRESSSANLSQLDRRMDLYSRLIEKLIEKCREGESQGTLMPEGE